MSNDESSIILGKSTLLPGPKRNILVVGGAGTGKTYNYVLPNLLQCRGSYLVVDLDGSLRDATEEIFKEKGYTIKTLRIRAMSLADAEQMDLSKISFEPTVVYISPSLDKALNDAVIPMFVDKIIENTHDNGIPVHLFLDEFCNLGQIPYFYCLLANKKISYSIIIQSPTQLELLYKDSWLSIVGNCDIILYLGGQDIASLSFIVRMLGKETVNINGFNYERKVFTSDDLRRMEPTDCLIISRGQTPTIDQKYDPQKHPNYKIP